MRRLVYFYFFCCFVSVIQEGRRGSSGNYQEIGLFKKSPKEVIYLISVVGDQNQSDSRP